MLDAYRINTNLKTVVFVLAVTMSFIFASTVFATSASAQEEVNVEPVTTQAVDAELTTEVTTTDVETTAETAVTYRFVAEKCDNLTKLVRRAILTYDEANTEIELTPEGIVFAETNIVQDMGAYWLDIGDVVVIEGAAVEMYAAESLGLSEGQVAAWNTYVPFVDFEIEDIQQPEDKEEIVETIQEEVEAENNPAPEVEEADDEASAVWWFVGVGAVAIVWYLLWKREEQ